ncbi:MAG: diaminopimelate epimerase [Firmicutes bacterium]|nr:diaminopimelate epimerase [Bacillota bacterium]
MRFTKMQGCGNDYIYVNCFEESVKEPEKLAVKISDRHFGVGSDGLVLITKSDVADCRMRMYNSDGSEAEMCGNASRCVAKYVYDKGIVKKDTIALETGAGIKYIDVTVNEKGEAVLFKVNMGKPILEGKDIPVESEKSPVIGLKLKSVDRDFDFTCVSMGNPHAVTFISDDIASFELEKYGAPLETDKHFPKKSNIEFAKVTGKNTIDMRVWERGAGETLACGTGACATAVAACLEGLCERKNIKIKLLGGELDILWSEEDGNVYMTGPAEFVFEGTWEI